MGGGVGIYMSKVEIDEGYNCMKNGVKILDEEEAMEAKASSMIPHINAGFDFNMTENISIAIDLRYIFGKIKSFKIKESYDKNKVGNELKFVDEKGMEKNFQWELNGLNFGIFLRVKL